MAHHFQHKRRTIKKNYKVYGFFEKSTYFSKVRLLQIFKTDFHWSLKYYTAELNQSIDILIRHECIFFANAVFSNLETSNSTFE